MYPLIASLGDFKIYSYPLFTGFAWGVAIQVAQFLLYKLNIKFDRFALFVMGLFVASWLGAKVFFLIFSSAETYQDYLNSSHFWLGGGFVFYGGLITGLLYILCYRFIVDKNLTFQKLVILLPPLALGHAVGRIGCFLAGCCYGKETHSFLSIHLHEAQRHPVQLYEAFLLLILGLLTIRLLFLKTRYFVIISFYFISYASIRFSLEFMRGDNIRGIFFSYFSTSQLISVFIILLALLFFYITYKQEKPK